MIDTLEHLRSEIIPVIASMEPDVSRLYAPEGRLQHFAGLARAVERALGDPHLTTAAFLHGLPSAKIREIPGISPTVLDILEDWQVLRKMPAPTPPVAPGVFRGDIRALALYIYDSLANLDPDGDLLRWTLAFPLEAHQPPDPATSLRGDATFLPRVRQVIAPIARAWGFWMEGNALLNAALQHEQPERFRKALDYIFLQQRLDRGCVRHVRLVREALVGRVDPASVRWEWHHVASIAANLEGTKEADWHRLLHRCGYVTVQCPDEDACYLVMGTLHRVREHRRQDVRDYIGSSTPARYRALHTLLSTLDDEGDPLFVPVRFVPDEPETRFALMDAERFTWTRTNRGGPGRSLIRVLTPGGAQKLLPQGATVLNFAGEIHQDFVAQASHAILNGRVKVDLLHPLSDGDEVEIVRGEVRTTLPAGWEDRVPNGTAARILDAWKKYWRDALAKEGHRWLARRLNLPEDEHHLVRILVDMALVAPTSNGPAGKGATWWLTQIGLHFGSIKAPVETAPKPVEGSRLRDLVSQIEDRAGAFAKFTGSLEVMTGGPKMGQARSWRWCGTCRPVLGNDIVFTVNQHASGVEIVMHRHGLTCSQGGMPLVFRDRVRLDQFFVIETNNQVGVGLQILEVFRDERVDVVEIVGRRLGTDWGVFRLEVDPVATGTIHRIKRRLESLESVNSVRTPLDTGSAILEASLPPRCPARSPLTRPTPYLCGPVAIDDQHFYGREDEIGTLFDLLRQVRDLDTAQGLTCFVQGPLRIGKTSLVLRFQLLLRRQPELGVVPVYLKAGLGETWNGFQRRLEAKVQAALRQVWRVWDLPTDEMPRGSYDEMIRSVANLQRRPAFVIAIDEAHRLFGACSQNEEDRRELARFRDFVEATPGVLTVWVGTGTGTRDLHEDVQQVVLSATPLPIRPFSLDQAIELLEARKLSLFHTITMERDLARRLFNLTGGEPFLLANLVGIMWSRRQDHGSRVVRFDRNLVETARREMLSRHEVFAQRVDPTAPDRDTSLAWRLTRALAREAAATGHPLTTSDLATRVLRPEDALETGAVEKALSILQERGAVVPCDDGSPRWRVAFPLLTEYLNQPT